MTIHSINPTAGLYGVESENPKSQGRTYTVSVKEQTCTCPHSLYRGATYCKHRQAVDSYLACQTKLAKAQAVAETLSDADLKRWAAEKIGTAAGCACLLVLAKRQAERQPRPIPPGVMDLLAGATESERERALACYR